METAKLFNQVIDKFPAVSSIKIWSDVEGNKLIGWQNKHIYFCNLTNLQIMNIMMSTKVPSCYEELVSPVDLVEVLCIENSLYAVDRQCYISEIVRETVQDPDWEGDLFEDTPKNVMKHKLKRKYRISKDSELLAACLLPGGIAFLLNTPISILVKIIDARSFNEIKSFVVRSTPITLKPKQNVSLMLFVPKEEIEAAYIRNWFPGVKTETVESDLLIISLPECIICGVLLEEIPLIPHFIFSWPFQAVKARWFCLEDKEPNRINRKSSLLLVFDGGAIVILEQYGGKTTYMPLNIVRNAYISSDFILVTDNTDCYFMKAFEYDEIACLPIKGVLGFCQIPEQNNIIVVLTKHRTLYAVNLDVKVQRETFKMPETRVFDDFLKKIKYLDQVCKKIAEKDDYINALSYALNSAVMKFSFSVQIALIAGSLHTFRIKIQSENPGITFRSVIWKLSLSMYSHDCCFTFIRNLEYDITTENILVDFITLDCSGNNWDLHVDASFISFIGNDKYRPTVNIGTVLLDISHFIQPVSSIKIHQSHIEKDICVKQVLEDISLTCSNQINYTKNTNRKSLCAFEIPINEELTTECAVDKLLSNSRALWRKGEWEEICKKDKFQIFVAGDLFNIEIKKGFITISGNNGENCHSLKVASALLLNVNFKINDVGNHIQNKVDDLLKVLDLLQYNSADSFTCRYNKTLALYKELKENIIYPLTGIKMIFDSKLIGNSNILKKE